MKKIYAIITFHLIGLASIAQLGQIENGNFETWQGDYLYESPTNWKSSNTDEFYGVETLAKSTDANDGSFSCLLTAHVVGNDTLSPYVYHGNVSGGGGPDQGIPYSDNFEAVSLSYKCDLQVGDSLQLIVLRFLGGTAVEFQSKPVAYNTAGVWTDALIYLGNQSQDSLFIGFIVGDVVGNGRPKPGSWAMIDNIQLISGGVATSELPNKSFETWNTVTVENPSNWFTLNSLLAGSNAENAIKTIDANSGSFALELSTIQSFNSDTINGLLSMGLIDFSNQVTPFALAPYNAQPTNFSGAYKYSPVNGDEAGIQILFYQGGTQIGFHYEVFSAQASYTNFSSPITTGGVPDSILFVAYSGDNPGSVLKLDDLQFTGGDVGIEEINTIDFELYPNPASNQVSIKLPIEGDFDIEISDLKGTMVSTFLSVNGIQVIDLKQFAQGTYIVQVRNDKTNEIQKLIIH